MVGPSDRARVALALDRHLRIAFEDRARGW
jgi:hypothetical protein